MHSVPAQSGALSSPAPYVLLQEGCAANEPGINFSDLQMVCPIDAADIGNRWLKPYVPDPSHKAKTYSGPIVIFIRRILKSHAAVVGKHRS